MILFLKKPHFLIAVSVAVFLVCSANAYSRTKTSLNNGWRFQKSDITNAQILGFDDRAWQSVSIPHTWNAEDAFDDEPGYYRGPGWYRRVLDVGKQLAGKQLFVYFEGANQVCDVYVNGRKAGSHIGGYSAFVFDITKLVRPGARNVLAVRVDNSFNEDIPPLTADFNFYGGIYRDVWLISTSDVHFDVTDHASPGVRITTPKIEKGDGTVMITGNVVNASDAIRSFELVTTVTDATNRVVSRVRSSVYTAAGRQTELYSKAVVPHPRLWSTDSPYLYTIRVSILERGKILDEVVQPLGFRWFNFDGQKGFSLNGKPTMLHGTNRHQDYAGLGNAVPNDLHAGDLKLIKDAGFNFVRLAHYPQDPSVLEACDRLGILVWEETPLVNYITKSTAFAENSTRMVREMIRQHHNHPSVMLWGYMNEIYLRVPKGRDELYPATVELAKELNRIAKEEDPTRPTTIALHGNDIYNKTGLASVPDVVGWNLYQGWYSTTVTDFGKYLDDQHARFPTRPLIVSEYGANGDRRLHSNTPKRFDSTVEYQRFYHESYFAQMKARPYLSGSAIWSQFDFGSEYRGESIPHVNQKGMFTADRRPKDIHYFYKAQLSKEPVLHIAVRDAPRMAGISGNNQTIDIYSNLHTVELFLNGQSQGKKRTDDLRKASWNITLTDGKNELQAHGTDGKMSVRDAATVSFKTYNATSKDISINVGSNASFVDDKGQIWLADKPYSTGSWGFIGENSKPLVASQADQNILETTFDPLFQTMAEGIEAYKFDVPDGEYSVDLLFAETKFREPGKRVFDVLVNGAVLIEALDIHTLVGANRPYVKSFRATARNGLTISFRSKVGQPVLSGVSIRRLVDTFITSESKSRSQSKGFKLPPV